MESQKPDYSADIAILKEFQRLNTRERYSLSLEEYIQIANEYKEVDLELGTLNTLLCEKRTASQNTPKRISISELIGKATAENTEENNETDTETDNETDNLVARKEELEKEHKRLSELLFDKYGEDNTGNRIIATINLLEHGDDFSTFKFEVKPSDKEPTALLKFEPNSKAFIINNFITGIWNSMGIFNSRIFGKHLAYNYFGFTYDDFIKESKEKHSRLMKQILAESDNFNERVSSLLSDAEFIESERKMKIVKQITEEEFIDLRNKLHSDFLMLNYYIHYKLGES